MAVPLAIVGDDLPKPVYYPSKATLKVLNTRDWVVAYSGGKDSSSMATWIEWLRRTGLVKEHVKPRLVESDTTVEFPFLREVSDEMKEKLRACGWRIKVVTPKISERLYPSVFGRGLVPPLLSTKRIRWCTWKTKAVPMRQFAKRMGHLVTVTGVRLGESSRRDISLKKRGLQKKLPSGCAAGGECGIPAPTDLPEDGGVSADNMLAPIVNWRTCQVVDWLTGKAGGNVHEVLHDLMPAMAKLADVYEFGDGSGRRNTLGMSDAPKKIKSLRFGCVGCVAINKDRTTARQLEKRPELRHVNQIYRLWEVARRYENRIHRPLREGDRGTGTKVGNKRIKLGPVRMEVRKKLYADFLEIQAKLGLVLVTPEEDAFIRKCWEDKVYARGWSEEDE